MKHYMYYLIYFLGTNLALIAILRAMIDISNQGVVLILLITTFIHLYDLGWLNVNEKTGKVPLRTEIIILFVCLFSIYLLTLNNIKLCILLFSIMIALPIAIYEYRNSTLINTNNKFQNFISFIVTRGYGVLAVLIFVVVIIVKILFIDKLEGKELEDYVAYTGDSATILSLAFILSSYGFRKTKGFMSDKNLDTIEKRFNLGNGYFKQILLDVRKINDIEERKEAEENVEQIIKAVTQKKIKKALRIFGWLPAEIRKKHKELKEKLNLSID